MHKREGNMVKKNKVLIDRQNLEEEDFATKVAGSMGAMATKKKFTIGKIITRIKKSDKIIAQLQEQLNNVEERIREEMSKILEKTRDAERLEVQSLKTSLDEMS
jgi:glutaredoxin 2